MALLARLFDFTPMTPIVSSDVDAEFNQLVNILNGTTTNKNALVRYSNASDPPLRLDQLGNGAIQQWANTGVTAASVTNNGSFQTGQQFISTLSTGTKPLNVTSTTLCTNLNADLLDGLESSVFVRNDTASQTITDTLAISGSQPKLVFADTTGGDDDFEFQANGDTLVLRVTGGSDVLSIASSTLAVTFGAIPVLPGSDPVSGNQATRKSYVDALVSSELAASITSFAATFFYVVPPGATESVESTGRFNCPPGQNISILQIRAVYGDGSHTSGGNLTFTIKRRDSSGTLQADIGTITITDGLAKNVLNVNVLGAPVVLTDGDQIYPLLTTRSGTITEANISIILTGTQTLG